MNEWWKCIYVLYIIIQIAPYAEINIKTLRHQNGWGETKRTANSSFVCIYLNTLFFRCTLYIFNSIERLLIWKLLSTKWENKMKVFGFCFMFMHLSFVLCFIQRRKVHKFIHFIRLIVSNLFNVHRAIKKSSSYMHLCACVFPFSRYIN